MPRARTKSPAIHFRLPLDLWGTLQNRADHRGISVGEYCEDIVARNLRGGPAAIEPRDDPRIPEGEPPHPQPLMHVLGVMPSPVAELIEDAYLDPVEAPVQHREFPADHEHEYPRSTALMVQCLYCHHKKANV